MSNRRETEIAGEKVWLCALTGAVAGEKKWSESRTTGATNYYAPGQVIGQTIQTTVNTRHEFWLVAPDGEEKCVELGDSKVAVRENQVLTAIWGARTDRNSGPFLMLRNHNAQQEDWLIRDDKNLLKRMGLKDPSGLWALAGVGVGIVVPVLLHSLTIVTLVLSVSAIVGGFVLGGKKRKAKVLALKEASIEIIKLELNSRQTGSSLPIESGDPLLPV